MRDSKEREMFWDISVDSLLSPALEIKFPRKAHGETWLKLYPVAALAFIFRPLDLNSKSPKKCLSVMLFTQQGYL